MSIMASVPVQHASRRRAELIERLILRIEPAIAERRVIGVGQHGRIQLESGIVGQRIGAAEIDAVTAVAGAVLHDWGWGEGGVHEFEYRVLQATTQVILRADLQKGVRCAIVIGMDMQFILAKYDGSREALAKVLGVSPITTYRWARELPKAHVRYLRLLHPDWLAEWERAKRRK